MYHSVAQFYFSHKSLQGLNIKQMQEKLFQEKGVNFNDYPTRFKRGAYFKKVTKEQVFSAEELDRLPSKHEARRNPDLKILRSSVERVEFTEPLHKIENRVNLIFEN